MAATLIAFSAAIGGLQAAPPPLSGDHRLTLSFVEDGALISKAWFEAGGGAVRGDAGSDLGVFVLAAFRYGRDVEAGVAGGVLHRERDAGSELYGSALTESIARTGAADLRLYGKYRVLRSPVDLAVGATLELPLAGDDTGLTSGAVGGTGFVAMRGRLAGGGALVGHAGFSVSGDARFGTEAAGRTGLVTGIGVLLPIAPLWTWTGEMRYEGARFDGTSAATDVLTGLDWRPTENIAARGGLGAEWTAGGSSLSGVLSCAFYF